ncbi:hypothetical protein HVTV-2_gp14 [Haloarcula virus HVTV-2]|uniref:Uncharacterized protein n=1 Tax=Haloarcula vallismortis tailed virus 1 TaxID=1262528 RepID=L7TK77_9CAUD|nr:hypothetical protein HVTV1_14 [Haloarcula vallismortis tailed virus 1]AGC34385.1 hypothetical protein HVTV1_14 [Haloarcula vallismortis tailed virus 1]UBF22821.1 hypothetical protein HVTV-2_gp14 [Haloarcula virus HVTV-2]
MSETEAERTDAVAQALQSVGYNAEARHDLGGIVNVYDPSSAEKMYERADGACGGLIDVRMTTSTKFQIDVNPKGRYD